MNDNRQSGIEVVLESKVPPVPLISEAEGDAILQHHREVMDSTFIRDFEAHAADVRNMIDRLPPADAVDLQGIRGAEGVGGSAELPPIMAIRYPEDLGSRPPLAVGAHHECDLIVKNAPFTYGSPSPVVLGPTPSEFAYRYNSSASLAMPEWGLLSLGLGCGWLGGAYPSNGNWLLGEYSTVQGSILHVASFPGGPIDSPSAVNVQVQVQAGDSTNSTGPYIPYLLIPGDLTNEGNGLVGLFGKAYLELWALRPHGENPKRSGHVFLDRWATKISKHQPATFFPIQFDLSETISIEAGADSIVAIVTLQLAAFHSANGEQRGTGFAGIDLQMPSLYEGHSSPYNAGLWTWQPQAGPIKISNLQVEVCQDRS